MLSTNNSALWNWYLYFEPSFLSMACIAKPKSPITLIVSAKRYIPFLSRNKGIVCTSGLELIRAPLERGTKAILFITGVILSDIK